jgi:hypothetical protein
VLGRQRPGDGHADLDPILQLPLGAHLLGVEMDPSMDRAPISIGSTAVVAMRRADLAGSTRISAPPCPLVATAMLPPISNASPPNILCSVSSGSASTSSRIRSTSRSS